MLKIFHLVQRIRDALSFDNFSHVLRPFIIEFYDELELEKAFPIEIDQILFILMN